MKWKVLLYESITNHMSLTIIWGRCLWGTLRTILLWRVSVWIRWLGHKEFLVYSSTDAIETMSEEQQKHRYWWNDKRILSRLVCATQWTWWIVSADLWQPTLFPSYPIKGLEGDSKAAEDWRKQTLAGGIDLRPSFPLDTLIPPKLQFV